MAAPVYADHPFAMLPTPSFPKRQNGETTDIFDDVSTEMTLIHNLLLRSLNSIHLQAPHIVPADVPAFCRYTLAWYTLIHLHHTGEESMFFPAVERMSGETGVMDAEKAQHAAFDTGVSKLKAYVEGVVAGTEAWDGARLQGIIDDFGGILQQHLGDEIRTLQGLRRFGGEKMAGIYKAAEEEAEHAMKQLGGYGLAWAFQQIDQEFEGGLWKDWPAAPFPVKFIAKTVMPRFYGDALKFSACDRSGKLQPLYALREANKA